MTKTQAVSFMSHINRVLPYITQSGSISAKLSKAADIKNIFGMYLRHFPIHDKSSQGHSPPQGQLLVKTVVWLIISFCRLSYLFPIFSVFLYELLTAVIFLQNRAQH